MRRSYADIECFNETCPSHVLSEDNYKELISGEISIKGPVEGDGWYRMRREGDKRFRSKHVRVDDHVTAPKWTCCACGKSGVDYAPKAHYDGPSYPHYNVSAGVTFTDKYHEKQYIKDNGCVVKDYQGKNRARPSRSR